MPSQLMQNRTEIINTDRRRTLVGGLAGGLGGLLATYVPATARAQPNAADPSKGILLEGHLFTPTQQVAGSALQLNGVGLRAVAWIKGYAAAL